MSQKILVIGPAWVGDMVMAQSLFKLLRERQPRVIVDVVAPSWSAPLLARMPEVRRAIPLDAGHSELALFERYRLGRSLKAECYDRAIILPRSAKAALLPFVARIPVRTGFRAELRSILLTDPRPLDRPRLDQTVKRLLTLGLLANEPLPARIPLPQLTIDPANRAALMRKHHLDPARGAIALLPGAAFGPAKMWPIEYFGELARLLIGHGEQVWVLGSADERGLGERIRELGGVAVRNLCGETRLEDTVDLLSAARAAVTNDSGLMHVAGAAGTRVIAIYGSSSPAFTPPLTERATIHYLGLECSPCFQRECPLGHLRCLKDINPVRIFSSMTEAALTR